MPRLGRLTTTEMVLVSSNQIGNKKKFLLKQLLDCRDLTQRCVSLHLCGLFKLTPWCLLVLFCVFYLLIFFTKIGHWFYGLRFYSLSVTGYHVHVLSSCLHFRLATFMLSFMFCHIYGCVSREIKWDGNKLVILLFQFFIARVWWTSLG